MLNSCFGHLWKSEREKLIFRPFLSRIWNSKNTLDTLSTLNFVQDLEACLDDKVIKLQMINDVWQLQSQNCSVFRCSFVQSKCKPQMHSLSSFSFFFLCVIMVMIVRHILTITPYSMLNPNWRRVDIFKRNKEKKDLLPSSFMSPIANKPNKWITKKLNKVFIKRCWVHEAIIKNSFALPAIWSVGTDRID